MIAARVVLVASTALGFACQSSSVGEYYALLERRDEAECECVSDQAQRELCSTNTKNERDIAHECAVEYVESSRKHRKRVEPIYDCFAETLRPYVDCLEDSPCGSSCDARFDEGTSICYLGRKNNLDGTPSNDAAVEGYEDIRACIADAYE